MAETLTIDVISIFPGIVRNFAQESILKRAVENGIVVIRAVNLRDFTTDRHKTTDDRPYGGGSGMIMKPGPIFSAVESLRTEQSRVLIMSPQGRAFNQALALELAAEKHLIFVCGNYEGMDERVRAGLAAEEISVGDYILTNGALSAAVIIDAVARLLPGALGGKNAAELESFANGMLEYPQYTRPENFRGMKVPEILLSGNHEEISRWRERQSLARTREKRPDLLK